MPAIVVPSIDLTGPLIMSRGPFTGRVRPRGRSTRPRSSAARAVPGSATFSKRSPRPVGQTSRNIQSSHDSRALIETDRVGRAPIQWRSRTNPHGPIHVPATKMGRPGYRARRPPSRAFDPIRSRRWPHPRSAQPRIKPSAPSRLVVQPPIFSEHPLHALFPPAPHYRCSPAHFGSSFESTV